jgi:hypothetical protein
LAIGHLELETYTFCHADPGLKRQISDL